MAQLVQNPPAVWETWIRKILGDRKGYPLQFSDLDKFIGLQSQTRLSDVYLHTYINNKYHAHYNTLKNVMLDGKGYQQRQNKLDFSLILTVESGI